MDRARAAGRAAFERVRALYDRARDTLDGRLAALSAQWNADQDQQALEKSALDERLQELAQQVTDFAGQHEKQAAALQAQLQQLETQVGLLDDAVRQHRRGLQGASRLVAAGLNRLLFSVNYFGLLATIILAGSGATWTGVESMVMA